MQTFLRYGVILSFFTSLISLAILILKTFSFGKRAFYAEPQGKGRKGILYAFTRGMMPWEKESARKHLMTYIAGVFYHSGIFSAMLYIFSLVVPFNINIYFIYLLRILMGIGIVCGLGLLLKRIFLPFMSKISCLDDYAANILVDIALILAFAVTFNQNIRTLLFLVTIFLLLYLPLGKIRHCFFFFYTRILFGVFFGRRGVLPQKRFLKF